MSRVAAVAPRLIKVLLLAHGLTPTISQLETITTYSHLLTMQVQHTGVNVRSATLKCVENKAIFDMDEQ